LAHILMLSFFCRRGTAWIILFSSCLWSFSESCRMRTTWRELWK